MFRNLDLLLSSGKKGRTESLAVRPLGELGLRLAQPGGPIARVSVLPFLPEDGRRSSFRKVVILLKYRRWKKSKKPRLQITINLCNGDALVFFAVRTEFLNELRTSSDQYHVLTLHVPTTPNHIVQADLVFPSQTNSFEPVPFRRRQFLSVTQDIRKTSELNPCKTCRTGVLTITQRYSAVSCFNYMYLR
jgi:hypothetical protein